MKPIRAAAIRGLAFGLAALLAASCLPVTSKSPVGTTVGLGADPLLLGTWKSTGKDAPGYFHFLRAENGTLTVLTVMPASPKGDSEWSRYTATTATLGARHFLNAREVSNNGKAADAGAPNIPLLYTVDAAGAVALYLIDEAAAKDAIAAGRIEGTIEDGDYGNAVLTAAPGKLDAFFARADGAALFKEKLVVLTKQN